MVPSNAVTCWGTSMLYCQHDRQKCFELLQPVWSPKAQTSSKEISQIHEGLLHQRQLDTTAQIQTQAEEINLFLNAETWENIPREILSFSFSCCLCLSSHYLPTLESGCWARWTFALNQFQFCVFCCPEESQSHVQRMKNWVLKLCKSGELQYTYFTDDEVCVSNISLYRQAHQYLCWVSDCSLCFKWLVQG